MSDLVQPPRSRQATRQFWVDCLARFPNSGLSVAAFCAGDGVSVNSYFYWKRQLAVLPRILDAEPCFLPVRITLAAPVELVLTPDPIPFPHTATSRL